ncbi:MAG: AbrB/MazE/SpoVT family DNA-binding domain-containing protein [Nanoarchaeota archaeon]|nr:AbrB/MazE/SpoVT family DNA-binding domain-containing protein [Nanoarchaeota archaeon]
MMDVITMSSKGQFVIPRNIREEMGIEKQDKFIIVHDDDSILLKKIKKQEINKKMTRLLDSFSQKFQEAGITLDDVKTEIKKARAR